MKTKLAHAPIIHGWMSAEEKRFRMNFDEFLRVLPHLSFLDPESYEVDGYLVGESVGSVVAKVHDASGTYVIKASASKHKMFFEAKALNAWAKNGAHVLVPKALIHPSRRYSFSAIIFPFVTQVLTEDAISSSDRKALTRAFRALGSELRKMHHVQGKGYGNLKLQPGFVGAYKTFSAYMKARVSKAVREECVRRSFITAKEAGLFARALRIVESHIADGQLPVVAHFDASLYNTFGTKNLLVFDPNPGLSHPYIDLAQTCISMQFEARPQELERALCAGYGFKPKNNHDRILAACIYLRVLQKWKFWLTRAKTEPRALRWIQKTTPLFRRACKSILSS